METPTMQLSTMGYYNAVVRVSDASNIRQLFEPTKGGEEVEVIEDVEKAIQYLSEYFDADVFNSPRKAEELKNIPPEEIFQKAMVLERLRFELLREDWEPMFDPWPHNPLQYYDPDVKVGSRTVYVRVENGDGEYVSRQPVKIHDWEESYDDPDEYEGGRFWIKWKGIKAEGDDIVEVADEFHDRVEEVQPEYVSEQLEEKLSKLLQDINYETDTEVNLELFLKLDSEE